MHRLSGRVESNVREDIATMIVNLRSQCHPEANGRTPISGEQQWSLSVPLENGDDYLELHVGRRGFEALKLMLDKMSDDDLVELQKLFVSRGRFCQSLLDELQILQDAINQAVPFISIPDLAAHTRNALKRCEQRREQYANGD